MTFEHKRLLSVEHDDATDTESQVSERQIPERFRNTKQSWLPAVLVLYSLVATALLVLPHLSRSSRLQAPYSPIAHLIQPTVQHVYPKSHSVFSEEPSDEVDAAWTELVAPILIQASESELKSTNENPAERVELIQGGYLGNLGVFYELHCLRRLYWHMYEGIYFPNMTETDLEHKRRHARDCIEALRISLMCQANTALYTYEWDESAREKQHLTSEAKRQCIRWEPIHNWASERSVGLNPQFHRPHEDSKP